MSNSEERAPQSGHGFPPKQQPRQKTPPGKSDPGQSPGKDKGSGGTGPRQGTGGSRQQGNQDE